MVRVLRFLFWSYIKSPPKVGSVIFSIKCKHLNSRVDDLSSLQPKKNLFYWFIDSKRIMNNWTQHPKKSVTWWTDYRVAWFLAFCLYKWVLFLVVSEYSLGNGCFIPLGRTSTGGPVFLALWWEEQDLAGGESEERSDQYEVWGSCMHSQERILKSRIAKQIVHLCTMCDCPLGIFPSDFPLKTGNPGDCVAQCIYLFKNFYLLLLVLYDCRWMWALAWVWKLVDNFWLWLSPPTMNFRSNSSHRAGVLRTFSQAGLKWSAHWQPPLPSSW